ncbi:zinc finger MYND domain-containing protein [Aspergillus mulundensis]|uniref:MYND-type domain-containing protein n=1 Tax=Aspergillus mulundensis TaxID=1810919 RepID=A0A3D8S415_9EURO|nr:hypothetical protein DSM5745_04599 [Aspergillus mulundensis]RDW81042.1 hypothetical protein DSM5745_04599 [Aspergillus mulundensis]
MASLTSSCANCAMPATLQCTGCKDTPEYKHGDASPVFYCSKACQTDHRPRHLAHCKTMATRKKLVRIAAVCKAAVLGYRELEYDVELSAIELLNNRFLLAGSTESSTKDFSTAHHILTSYSSLLDAPESRPNCEMARLKWSFSEWKHLFAKHLASQPADAEQKREYDQKFLDQIPDQAKIPIIAASSCSLADLNNIFSLKEIPDPNPFFRLRENEWMSLPTEFEERLRADLDMMGRDPRNETECRLTITALLLECLRSERQLISRDTIRDTITNLPEFTLETHLTLNVIHKGVLKQMSGDMDYSVWHEQDDYGTHLTILEAKDLGGVSSGISQCLAYMCMIHQIRKQAGRVNCVVYGCVTDGRDFTFLKINNNTEWTQWRPTAFWNQTTKHQIYTMLRLIIRNAITSSPRSSVVPITRPLNPEQPLTFTPGHYHMRIGSEEDEQLE